MMRRRWRHARLCRMRTEKNTRGRRGRAARSRLARDVCLCVAKLCGIVARRRSAVNPYQECGARRRQLSP